MHDSTAVNRSVAIQDGTRYYHPDCYEVKTKVVELKEYFLENINGNLTYKEVTELYTNIYKLIFEDRRCDLDFLIYAVHYMAENNPGKLRFPGGIFYIIDDKDIIASWKRIKRDAMNREQKRQIEIQQENLDFEFELPDTSAMSYSSFNKSRFSRVVTG